MIRPEKYSHALTALQQVIVRARFLAQKAEPHDLIASLLDEVEYLPQLIAATEDRTESFASALQSISENYPYCRHIFTEFDRTEVSATVKMTIQSAP